MKKKFLTIILTALLSFSITACGGNNASVKNEAINTQKTANTSTELETQTESELLIDTEILSETEAIFETETETAASTETNIRSDAPQILCVYEDIEPVTVTATTYTMAMYDPNFLYALEQAGEVEDYEVELYHKTNYLRQGGAYDEGTEGTFSQKTTYDGVEYYSAIFGNGFRMILPVENFQ